MVVEKINFNMKPSTLHEDNRKEPISLQSAPGAGQDLMFARVLVLLRFITFYSAITHSRNGNIYSVLLCGTNI